MLANGGPPSWWFIRPALFGFRLPASAGELRVLAFASNPVAWLGVLPAIVLLAVRAARRRDARNALVPLLFAAIYAPLLVLDRPIFLYSAVAVLPLGLLAITRAAALAKGTARIVASGALLVACAVALYLYPLATARSVPRWAYAPAIASSASLLGARD